MRAGRQLGRIDLRKSEWNIRPSVLDLRQSEYHGAIPHIWKSGDEYPGSDAMWFFAERVHPKCVRTILQNHGRAGLIVSNRSLDSSAFCFILDVKRLNQLVKSTRS